MTPEHSLTDEQILELADEINTKRARQRARDLVLASAEVTRSNKTFLCVVRPDDFANEWPERHIELTAGETIEVVNVLRGSQE